MRMKNVPKYQPCFVCGKAKRKHHTFQNNNEVFCSRECMYQRIGEPKIDNKYFEMAVLE